MSNNSSNVQRSAPSVQSDELRAQGAGANAHMRSEATGVEVSRCGTPGLITLKAADDGDGFDPDVLHPETLSESGGFGLNDMR